MHGAEDVLARHVSLSPVNRVTFLLLLAGAVAVDNAGDVLVLVDLRVDEVLRRVLPVRLPADLLGRACPPPAPAFSASGSEGDASPSCSSRSFIRPPYWSYRSCPCWLNTRLFTCTASK